MFLGLAATFAFAGSCFLFLPDGTVHAVSRVGALFGYAEPPGAPLRFWLGLGVAYMMLVTILALQIGRAPRRNAQLMPILAAGKATSALTCLGFYLRQPSPAGDRVFIYLANFLVDGSLVLIVVAAWGALWLAPVPGARTVERDRSILAALLDTLIPGGGPFPLGGADDAISASVSRYFRELDWRGETAFRLLLRTLEWSSLLLAGGRFSRLSPARRERLLARLARSRISAARHLSTAIKLVVTMRFYGDPRAERAIGYDGEYVRGRLLAGPNREAHAARLDGAGRAALAPGAIRLAGGDGAAAEDGLSRRAVLERASQALEAAGGEALEVPLEPELDLGSPLDLADRPPAGPRVVPRRESPARPAESGDGAARVEPDEEGWTTGKSDVKQRPLTIVRGSGGPTRL